MAHYNENTDFFILLEIRGKKKHFWESYEFTDKCSYSFLPLGGAF